MYKVVLLPDAESSFRKLDRTIQTRIVEKIDWLSGNADAIVHHALTSLPDDLRGLCRVRVGDYRILCQILEEELVLVAVIIGHRKNVYKN